MLAGCELPLAAAPAEAWAAMVSAVAPPVVFFMKTLASGAEAGTTGFGAGASKTGFKMGAGSAFLAGATGAGLAAALGFTATGFFLARVAGFACGFFFAMAVFEEEAADFLAGAFLDADFLAIVVDGSELFQFPRG